MLNKNIKIRRVEKNEHAQIIHKVAPGEKLEDVAKKYKQTKEYISKLNQLSGPIEEGDRLLIGSANTAIYVVKPLDTLQSIAAKFKVSTQHIQKNNNTQKIFIGQLLVI